jgi:hypothetical protein
VSPAPQGSLSGGPSDESLNRLRPSEFQVILPLYSRRVHDEKALVINTTLFREEDYKAELELPMTRIIDDWGLRYPGVKKVEHIYFYRVPTADDETKRSYLERAYNLGKEFSQS